MIIKYILNFLLRGAAVCLLLSPASLKANSDVTQHDADNRAKALKTAETPNDSIHILLDVYNLSDKSNQPTVKEKILDLAKRTDNSIVLTDIVSELAAATDDTRELGKLIQLSESITEEGQRKTAETFLNMEQARAEAAITPENELQEQILRNTRNSMIIGLDPYQEIQNLYRSLVFLGNSSQGPLYLEYITRLGELVKNLPEKDHAIKNLYYTTAAIYYTRKRDYKNALEADRALIKEIEGMENLAIKNGRDISDFDYFKFISYRRMLRNFKGLTPEEIEDIYAKCVQLAKTNEAAGQIFDTTGLTNSYYYVGTGRFREAVPELRKALSNPDISKFRRMELTGLLAWALRETGDYDAELKALREYTIMVSEDLHERRDATYREIELRNNVNELMSKEYLEAEKIHEENRRMRRTSLTLLYVFGLIFILIARAYLKLRQKVKLLESGNKKLRTNIEQIFDNGAPSGTMSLGHGRDRLKG